MDLSTLTTEQLKALAFDQVVQKDQAQNNLNAIVGEINRRSQQPNITEAQVVENDAPAEIN